MKQKVLWDKLVDIPENDDLSKYESEPKENAAYADLPGPALKSSTYTSIKKDFADWVYANHSLEVFYSPLLEAYSNPGEKQDEFKARVTQTGREQRDAAIEELREKTAKAVKSLEAKATKASAQSGNTESAGHQRHHEHRRLHRWGHFGGHLWPQERHHRCQQQHLRRWPSDEGASRSRRRGEIKVGEDQKPLISIQITGVDLEPVLRPAETNDNQGNRRKLVRELLFGQLGVKDAGSLFTRHDFLWRGTQREVDVMYENVCDLADDRLRGRPDAWSVIIDYPFDERNRTPQDDLARLSKYRGGTARTLVWLPSFLSPKSLQELGRLVILDYILQGDRF